MKQKKTENKMINIATVIVCNVEWSNDVNTRRIISKKVGRNEPCPCGSGKKYKLCHGS